VRPYRASDDRRVVVLSACEALHGAVGLLGGPHIRFVHELVTTEGTVVRLLGWLARRGEPRVLVLAPTGAVREELAGRFPGLPVTERLDRHGNAPGWAAVLAYTDDGEAIGYAYGNAIDSDDRWWKRVTPTPASKYIDRPAVALIELGARMPWRKTGTELRDAFMTRCWRSTSTSRT
jgi:hypothetical protein